MRVGSANASEQVVGYKERRLATLLALEVV